MRSIQRLIRYRAHKLHGRPYWKMAAYGVVAKNMGRIAQAQMSCMWKKNKIYQLTPWWELNAKHYKHPDSIGVLFQIILHKPRWAVRLNHRGGKSDNLMNIICLEANTRTSIQKKNPSVCQRIGNKMWLRSRPYVTDLILKSPGSQNEQSNTSTCHCDVQKPWKQHNNKQVKQHNILLFF